MFRILLCGLFLLVGCAPAATQEGGGDAPPASQQWALSDGTVTEPEYRQATEGFTKCVRAADVPAKDAVISPIDNLTLLNDIPMAGDPDAWSKALEDCNQAHVSHIEAFYVEQHEQKMTPELRDAVVACLRDRRLRPQGTERNVKELVDSTGDSAAVTDCVTAQIQTLYPELPDYLKIRW